MTTSNFVILTTSAISFQCIDAAMLQTQPTIEPQQPPFLQDSTNSAATPCFATKRDDEKSFNSTNTFKPTKALYETLCQRNLRTSPENNNLGVYRPAQCDATPGASTPSTPSLVLCSQWRQFEFGIWDTTVQTLPEYTIELRCACIAVLCFTISQPR